MTLSQLNEKKIIQKLISENNPILFLLKRGSNTLECFIEIFLLRNDSCKNVIIIDAKELLSLYEKADFEDPDELQNVKKFAEINGLNCYYSVFNIYSSIILSDRNAYSIEDNTIKRLQKEEKGWNLSHPFFNYLVKLDESIQREVLIKLSLFTKKVTRIYFDIHSDEFESYLNFITHLKTLTSLEKFIPDIFTSNEEDIRFRSPRFPKIKLTELFNHRMFSIDQIKAKIFEQHQIIITKG